MSGKPSHCSAVFLFLPVLFLLSPLAQAQPNHPWTIEDIFGRTSVSIGHPPEDLAWAPDGNRVSWIDGDGNLVALQPTDAKPRTLLSADEIATLLNTSLSERDRDHRARYGQPDYIWAPDSDHVLFDTNGQLWLFTLSNGVGVQVANTGMLAGDDPKFSPNGQLISYIHDHNIYVQRPDGTTPALALTSNPGDDVLSGEMDWVYPEELDVRSNYFWSPDSRAIAYLQMNESNVPEYPIIDAIPVHVTIDEQRYPQAGDPNPAVRVGVVGSGGGATRWLRIPLDEGNDYIPRFGWVNPHVVWVETLSRDHQHEDLWFADTHTGDVRRVLSQTDAKYCNTTYDVRFVDDHTFLVLSWRDGHTHMYRYTFNAYNPLADLAQLTNQLESGDYEVSSIAAVDPGSQTVWYLSNEGDPRQQQVWAVHLDGGGKHQITQGSGFHEDVFPDRGGPFIDTYSRIMTPPTISMCREGATAAGSLGVSCTPFWRPRPIEHRTLAAPEMLVLTASDKTTKLYGTLLLPPGKHAPHSVPLIVNPYGGPGASTVHDAWGGRRLFFDELLAEHGFAVLHVDNRGMSNRGRDFEQVCYHNFGPPQFADQMASIDQVLRDYSQLDPHRLGWWGWSWGGSFTLFALSHSDSFLAGVAGAPVTDWRNYDSIYTERYMGLPSVDSQNYHDDSDVTSAADLKGHILILHGTGDNNVHTSNDQQYIQKLIEGGIPYGYNIFPRKMHGVNGPDDQVELYGAIVEHFERYLMHPTPEETGRTEPSEQP
ncbi:MAG TPA: DPP IV N-terminal domain-containing protein [Acidobacteriaceae bacterium]|nr:DPP IV N-terminal domain-containing protein [Acidobacteriaceae bacterium]